MSEVVTLLANGQSFTGWKSVSISRSIKQLCGSFSLSLTERWSNGVGSDAPPQFASGDECQLYCGDDLVLSGYVDEALPNYDAEKHTISVTGRSKAADLIDCGHPGKQWVQPQTLLQLATELAGEVSVSVRAETDVGAAFQRPAIEVGETRFEFLEKLARQRGVRLMSDAAGVLLIVRAGTEVVPDSLELGRNIRSAGGRFSHKDRFNEIVVVGQTNGTDSWNGEAAQSNRGVAADGSIRSARRHVMVAENVADSSACKRRAEWQRNTAYGNGEALTYTVAGWHHSGGLWLPNTLVPVTDKWMRLDGEELLISALQYIIDDDGKRTELQVQPPEAFDLVEIPEKKAGLKKWS